jgi:acyl-CoA synthetase (AMP-forming)/AMP-acid ligase II
VGKPVLHTDVIMDREGNVLGPGQVGELCIRGGNVTSGYWNRPEATAEALKAGWLHSGDAAMCDDEGFYYIVDRWKDMFISGGENVYPAEVENRALHPSGRGRSGRHRRAPSQMAGGGPRRCCSQEGPRPASRR